MAESVLVWYPHYESQRICERHKDGRGEWEEHQRKLKKDYVRYTGESTGEKARELEDQ